MHTLNSTTVSHFWLPNGGLQLTLGEQRFAPESRSRLELSVHTHEWTAQQSSRTRGIRRQYHTSGSPMRSAVEFGGAKICARIALSLTAVRPNSRVNLHCNHHAHAEFDDGAKVRARIALSLRVVRPNSRVNLHCNHHAHAEFDDSITVLAPQTGVCSSLRGSKDSRQNRALAHSCPSKPRSESALKSSRTR